MLRMFTLSDRETVALRLNISFTEAENTINEWNLGSFNGLYFAMYAVTEDETVVGMISLYGHSKSIVSIGPEIFEEYRRRGLAKSAMKDAMRLAEERGYKIVFQQIRTSNLPSIALHESLGFERESNIFKNSKGNDVYFFLKPLTDVRQS